MRSDGKITGFKRVVAVLLVVVMVLDLGSSFSLLDSTVTAEAASSELNVQKLWEAARTDMHLNDDDSPDKTSFWADTSVLNTSWIKADEPYTVVDSTGSKYSVTINAAEQIEGSIGRRIVSMNAEKITTDETDNDIAADALADSDMDETERYALADSEMEAFEIYDLSASDNDTDALETYDLSDDDTDTEAPEIEHEKNTATVDCILSEGDTIFSFDNLSAFTVTDSENKVYGNAYTGVEDFDNIDTSELFYSVEHSNYPDGYYRQYYVSTAEQLAYLLMEYGNSALTEGEKKDDYRHLVTGLRVVEGTTEQDKDITSGTVLTQKLGIVLLCDIDLGGLSGKSWMGYNARGVTLEINGMGHTIYNGYYADKNSFFLGTDPGKDIGTTGGDTKFAMENVTFANQYMGRGWGMFSNGVQYAYFSNVNWQDCVAVSTTEQSVTIVLGAQNNYCYFKNCTIENSYTYCGKKGGGHSGMFASFNNTPSVSGTYFDDKEAKTSTTRYYTVVPDLEETERAWGGAKTANSSYSGKTLSKNYPSIYENCAVIQCNVYEAASDSQHSGIFVSCMRSCVIFRNCFANGTIYGYQQLGVFIGACIGAADGFNYPSPDTGKPILVSNYFENCYSSGEIEGKTKIGGFVGMVFNDKRATGDKLLSPTGSGNPSEKRGINVFKNCYSTASVGMEYSGEYVGGFIGVLRGNILGTDKKHRFINCYAAGEVGGITTDYSTTADNQNTIGGFLGTYVREDYETEDGKYNTDGIMTNCYYDKQTTAMRERDIGNYDSVSLYGTIKGLTGVYTKESTIKGVLGLTDLTEEQMGDTAAWSCGEVETTYGYYPQLASMLDLYQDDELETIFTNEHLSAEAQQMYLDREAAFRSYAYSSTAAVFLDHYDEILDEQGVIQTATSADKTIYDTVRDITRKFKFTTDDSQSITWAVDTEKNQQSGQKLYDQLNYTLDYGDIGADGGNISYTFDPYVLTIKKAKDAKTGKQVFQCLNFAPGKQWVKVEASQTVQEAQAAENASESQTDSTKKTSLSERNLRLLPSAYLDAGSIMRVNIVRDDNANTVTNEVFYTDENGQEIKLNGTFNHSIGVSYAITTRWRMTGDVYKKQALSKYDQNFLDTSTKDTNGEAIDTSTFAFYAKYDPLDSDMHNQIGDVKTGTDGQVTIGMLPQSFQVTTGDSSQSYMTNLSSAGTTRVRIYRATVTDGDVIQGDEITYDQTTLSKWQGEANFVKNSKQNDTGYYLLVYYWRLNDGRYLSDTKLVNITASSYTVEMTTGILDEQFTVDESNNTAIDQYVTDAFTSNTDSSLNWNANYPSKDADFSADTAQTYYTALSDDGDEYAYNQTYSYSGNTYYTKTLDLITNSSQVVVGWQRTTDYQLTTLLVEAVDKNNEVHQMARIDLDEGIQDAYSFDTAEYAYDYDVTYISQDPDSKLFTVTEEKGLPVQFKVEGASSEYASGIERYIIFNFANASQSGSSSQSAYAQINENLRVTALFRRNTADVSAEKYVLLNPESSVTEQKGTKTQGVWNDGKLTEIKEVEYSYYPSLSDVDEVYEVDDAGLTGNSRQAVLSGDHLTYRVKLQNIGYFESDVVNVYDTVPEGCTYVPGSMKIYRQYVMLEHGDQYGALETLAWQEQTGDAYETQFLDDSGRYGMEYNADTGALQWSIASIPLEYDYYVEYQVTVDDLSANKKENILTNSATWDFICRNGDADQELATRTLEELKAHEIFSLSIKADNGEGNVRSYEIDFEQKDQDTTYENIKFINTFPKQGFTLLTPDGKEITDETAKDFIQIYQLTAQDDGTVTETPMEDEDIQIECSDTEFTIIGLNLTKTDKYRVTFTGRQIPLGETDADGTVIEEISNKASITYEELREVEDQTGDTGQSTENGDGTDGAATSDEEKIVKGNSVSFTERITNTVETDETHLYLKIEKEIPVSDPSQTFLFKVERFDSQEEALNGAEPTSVFYTTINCTTEVKTEAALTDTTATVNTDAALVNTTGNDAGDAATTTTVYTGSRLIQVDQRGYYRITEVTDWSATDYDFGKVSSSEVSTKNYPSKTTTASGKIQTTLLAPLQGTITIQTVGEEKTQLPVAEFTLPRMMYEASQAFPTSMGSLADDTYPTVHFVDTESIYAYLSAQAYAQNTFNIFKDNTESAGTENTQPQENNVAGQQ